MNLDAMREALTVVDSEGKPRPIEMRRIEIGA